DPGVDYYPQVGQLTFDDFQMSADISVNMPVRPPGSIPFPVHFSFPQYNRVLVATITNVAYDPLETTNLSPPTANSIYTNTLLNILDQTTLPYTGQTGTNVFNFERATIRCQEGVGIARVGVWRVSDDYRNGTMVPYRIDYDFGNNRTINWDVFRVAPT